jgi:hypothetical protein
MTGKYGIHKQFFRKPRKVKGRIYRYRCKRLAPTPYSILVADNCFERLGERDMPTLGNDNPLPRGTVERLAAIGIDAYGPHPDFQMYVDHGLTCALGPLPMMTPPRNHPPVETIDLCSSSSESEQDVEELPPRGMSKELYDDDTDEDEVQQDAIVIDLTNLSSESESSEDDSSNESKI